MFDGFRFARMREAEGEGTKHQYVNTSTEYVSFGHGKHAWYVTIILSQLLRLSLIRECCVATAARDASSLRTS